MKTINILALLFIGSTIIYPTIPCAAEGILEVGRSRKGIRKVKSLYTFWQKPFLVHVKEQCKKYLNHVKVLMLVNKVYLIVFFVTLLVVLLELIFEKPLGAYYLLIAKSLLLDLPLIIFLLVMTEYDKKHGGKKWRYK